MVRLKRQRWWKGSRLSPWEASAVAGALWLGGLEVPSAVNARPVTSGEASSGSLAARSGPAVEPAPEPEAGAAALRDAQPFQVGLMDHGWPGPVVTPLDNEVAPSPPAGPAPPPADPRQATPTQTGPTRAEPGQGIPIQATPAPAPGGAPAVKTQPPSSRQLVLDRRRKVLRVLEGNRVVRRYPVAVGMPGWETPVGQFTVIEKRANPTWEHPASGHLLPPGPENPLGSRWIGFHRDCRGRSGFNGQEHLVVKGCVEAGFHGTPNRSSVGRAVSHGCVRLLDEHAKELFDLVSLGTPVIVLP